MKFVKFDSIEDYNTKNDELTDHRGYPEGVTLRYATEDPPQDVDGKYIMQVMDDIEDQFENIVEEVEFPEVEA